MFVFQVSARAGQAVHGLQPGQSAPCIVYIDFADAVGAEQLCLFYVLKAGLEQPVIEQRRRLNPARLQDSPALLADAALQDARRNGYHIRLFDTH